MSLEYAADCEWLDDVTRSTAKRLLLKWQAPPLDYADVREWILQVLGYFATMYNLTGKDNWDVAKLTVDPALDPVANADKHAGVHFIRKYYPHYMPTMDDFVNAYWGTKP
jgi:hypothetical protein